MSTLKAIHISQTAAPAQGKTKAKQRYLKAKKERRKKRKTASGAPAQATSAQKSRAPSASDEDSGSSDDENEVIPSPGNIDGSAPVEVLIHKESERPRKKRRISVVESPEEQGGGRIDVQLEPELQKSFVSSAPSHKSRSPSPFAALASFPLPKQPDAPSKTTLALQGLDKALIEAEIIDPRQTVPLSTIGSDDHTRLSERTRRRLHDLGVTELFAVQTAVVPFLLSSKRMKSLYLPFDSPRDLCVSAPTGSGKTLAYILPIVEILSSRIVTRLRALVVLPTRDLVTQVRETFEAVAKGRGLQIGTATGQHSFAHEQAQLVADKSSSLQGGSSKVDILICTPGRLMDHLQGTSNFSLQHLRFLVIDEADRLLAQSFQDWLARVLAATRPPSLQGEPRNFLDVSDGSPDTLGETVPKPDSISPAFLPALHDIPVIRTDFDEKQEESCQKLLFSATLTRDPAKISALGLHNPKYFVVQDQDANKGDQAEGVLNIVMDKFTMPATLTEHMLVCESSEKPLMLFHLVHAHAVTNALIFTKSAESTARLVRLFEFFEAAWAAEGNEGDRRQKIIAHAYSSDLGPSERKPILEKFKSQEIHILVCSDLVSRGIDISHVSHVVSYDAPVDMRKYVHRVGRTARAGRVGDAWTLVEEQEARYFKNMLKASDHLGKVARLRVSSSQVAPLRPAYENALQKLKETYMRSSLQ